MLFLYHALVLWEDIYHVLSPLVDLMISFFSYLKKNSYVIQGTKAWYFVGRWNNTPWSIDVKSSNLSYVGFENFGNKIHASNTKANHGLVFMFQSWSINFCQPVAIFTSIGTVKGVFTVTH